MSFGAFSLFNFYQQPNTGFQPPVLDRDILASGNGSSGKVADFNYYFPYGGTSILYGMILSQSQFKFNLLADSYSQDGAGGSHYFSISTPFSGNFQSSRDLLFFNNQVYGTLYPQFRENFGIEIDFSGIESGFNWDAILIKNPFSGIESGFNFDSFSCSVNISGDISSAGDPCYVKLEISGIISGESFDFVSIGNEVKGNLWPTEKDLCSIGFSMIGYSVSAGTTQVPITVSDSGNLNFMLVGYQVNI